MRGHPVSLVSEESAPIQARLGAPAAEAIAGRLMEIGAAWGDGYDTASLDRPSAGDGFTIWYARVGRLVGVLAHDDDDGYAHGRELIAGGATWPT